MKRYILLILAAVAVTACVESNINELQANRGDGKVVETITVGFENDETRIAVYSGKTKWSAGDLVSVFPRMAENQIWQFQGEGGARTGDLKYYEGASGPQVMDNIVVLYPHGEYMLDVENQTVKSSFFSESFNIDDAYSGCTMVASSDDGNFILKNTTGWLKISLTGNGERVSHFVIRGNNEEQIGGNIEIDVESAEVWFDDDRESTSEEFGDYLYNGYAYFNNYANSDGVATLSSTPIEVHFELIPQTFTKGITVEIHCEGFEPMVISTDDAVTIKRNHIQPMDAVEFDAPVGEEQLLVLLNAMKHSLLQTSANGYEHTDFGYHAIGVYNDHACKLIACNGWMFGYPDTYNRFQSASYGRGYGPDAGLAAQVWQLYYRAINKCNFIIGLATDNESLAVLRGLAKSYRAMLYLDLARMYECLPANTDNSPDYESGQMAVAGLTVPIVDENTTEEQAMNNPRASREEMFLFILNDLADAESSLAAYAPTAGELSLPVVYGLYARAYLWLGGFEDGLSGELPEGDAAYTLAAEYARRAINAFGGSVMYEYEWTDPYVGFTTMASSWMWGLIQTNETMINNLFQFTAHMSPEAAYGYGPLVMPGVASATYERLADTDFRKKVIKGPVTSYEEFAPYTTIDEYEFYYNFTSFVNFKFRPANGERNDYALACAVTLPLMRCEEMYFIEMEAIAHAQSEAAAKAKLEEFMAYRDDNYVCPETDIVEEIIFQKGVEFWGEGILMYDMKRLDMGVDSAYSSYNYYEYARFCTDGRIPWWTYCIPISAMSTNMALINNPDPSQSLNPIY